MRTSLAWLLVGSLVMGMAALAPTAAATNCHTGDVGCCRHYETPEYREECDACVLLPNSYWETESNVCHIH